MSQTATLADRDWNVALDNLGGQSKMITWDQYPTATALNMDILLLLCMHAHPTVETVILFGVRPRWQNDDTEVLHQLH